MSLPEQWGLPWPGAEVAAEAEAAGIDAFCASEFADHNPYVTVAEMALRTTTARIGTAVAYAFARSPFVHAGAVRHLHRLAPGRLFLGLGSGTRRMNADWFSAPFDPPLRRMEETVGAVRAWLHAENGERVRHDGELYPVDALVQAPVLGRLDVPIVIGAFNRGMLGVAGRCADGIVGHGLFTDRWWDEVVDPRLAEGAAQAGHDPASLLRWGWVIAAVDDADPGRAERDARLMVAFYLSVKTYDTIAALHGWEGPVAELRQAMARGDTDGMAAAVTDEMLGAVAVWGTVAEAADRLRARRRLPALAFCSPPSFMVSARRRAAYAEGIVQMVEALRA